MRKQITPIKEAKTRTLNQNQRFLLSFKGVVKKAKDEASRSDTAFGSIPVEKAVEEVAFADQSKDGWGFFIA